MSRIVISPKADLDLDDQFDYIAENNLDAAQRFLTAAQDAFTRLNRMPELGVLAHIEDIRFWPITHFRNHLIFYRPILNGIEIVRVLHGARDWIRVLEEEQNL